MFVARVAVTTTPEGRSTVQELLTAEQTSVVRDFPGCLRFDVSVGVDDPHHLHIIEEWEDQPSFAAYQQSPAFASVMSAVGPCLAGPPDSSYYEATLVGP